MNYHPNQFNEQIQTMRDKMSILLPKFRTYDILVQTHPEYAEYDNQYSSVLSEIQLIQSTLSALSTKMSALMVTIRKRVSKLNTKIEQEKQINTTLQKTHKWVVNTEIGSETMNDDYQKRYNTQLLQNVLTIIGLLGVVKINYSLI
jgi:hypothetical protein